MSDQLGDMRRTHHCWELGADDVDQEVVLMGWVHRRRDHGGVIFVDLRDREGITQVVFNPLVDKKIHAKAHAIRNEYVLAVRGKVENRPEDMINPKLKTGEIEVTATELKILNSAKTPPFLIEDEIDASETIRLKHRHLDLRRSEMQKNLILRHKATTAVRNYLDLEQIRLADLFPKDKGTVFIRVYPCPKFIQVPNLCRKRYYTQCMSS